MTEPDAYTYPRYLEAKRTVDARALNRRVWDRFVDLLATSEEPVRVLEVGGGVGATAQRVIRALETRSVGALRYDLVDIEPENVETARSALRAWAEERGYAIQEGREHQETEEQVWTDGPLDVSVRFRVGDLFDLESNHDGPLSDALVGQAVFDLFSIPGARRALSPLLRPGGLWYLPIHFDGVTAFEPPVDSDIDARIEEAYHESMSGEDGQESGRSGAHCGRRLLMHFQKRGELLEAGASDWVVFGEGGTYPGDEAYFLHHILHFIESELTGHLQLEDSQVARWISARRRQVEAGELTYIAHQLDVLARKDAAGRRAGGQAGRQA